MQKNWKINNASHTIINTDVSNLVLPTTLRLFPEWCFPNASIPTASISRIQQSQMTEWTIPSPLRQTIRDTPFGSGNSLSGLGHLGNRRVGIDAFGEKTGSPSNKPYVKNYTPLININLSLIVNESHFESSVSEIRNWFRFEHLSNFVTYLESWFKNINFKWFAFWYLEEFLPKEENLLIHFLLLFK